MGIKQHKSKLIGFTFRPFLADFSILKMRQKQKKSKAIAFTNPQKVKANAYKFRIILYF
jgi:hypothetical protein